MTRVTWTLPALRQLESIQDFIAKDNPAAAFELAEAIRTRALDQLSIHPLTGRSGRIEDTRELVMSDSPYIVAYRVRGNDSEPPPRGRPFQQAARRTQAAPRRAAAVRL